jgi:uncharacterized RDD family membrane protein YckC
MTTAGRLVYAGLVTRFLAYVLDALIVAVFAGGAAVLFGLLAAIAGFDLRAPARAVFTTYVVCLPSILMVYCALFWLLAGRTPGMAVLGLRVRTVDGRPVGWLAALVRALVLAYFPIGALLLLVDRRHQALHDKIARTSVVRIAPAELLRV